MWIYLINFILIIILLTAAVFDAAYKKIPNFITFPAMLIGLILNVIVYSWNGITFSLFGFLLGFAVFFIPFALGFIGAGDVKLMAAIGALTGWKFTFVALLYSSVAGLLVALVYLIIKHRIGFYLRLVFVPVARFILYLIRSVNRNISFDRLFRFAYSSKVVNIVEDKLYVPYGMAIAIGTLFALIFKDYIYL